MRRRGYIFWLVVLAALVGAPAAWARVPRGGGGPRRGARNAANARTPIDEFQRMPPEQQQRALDRLSPADRQRFQERLRRFNALPPEQRRSLGNLYNRLNQLPPERQKAVRDAMNRFAGESPERQQAMREELRGMAGSSEQEREARMAGPEFRSRLSHKEQGIVRDMAPLLGP